MELQNKVALVTGGAQGIGKTIGEELTKAGAHVVLGDVNLEGAQVTAEAINNNGGSASAIKINVSNATEVQQVFDFIMKDKKPVDIVVNNAGITRDGLNKALCYYEITVGGRGGKSGETHRKELSQAQAKKGVEALPCVGDGRQSGTSGSAWRR